MNKFINLDNLRLDESGRVEGVEDELRQLTTSEIKSVSGGSTPETASNYNYSWWCDGSDAPNSKGCSNTFGCDEETNQVQCVNSLSCELGNNTVSCTNIFDCDGSQNTGRCQ